MEVKCGICGKVLKNERALRSHNWRSHTDDGIIAINSLGAKTIGRKAWNVGLTKETDDRVRKTAESASKTFQKNGSSFLGKKHSEETKLKISLKLSQNNNGGRCKWFRVTNNMGQAFAVQGTWERDFSKYLNTIDNEWIKIGIGNNEHTYQWKDTDNTTHHYTPDFWSPMLKKYFEVKGYWWGSDREKMKLVLEQNELNIEIVEKKAFIEYMKLINN